MTEKEVISYFHKFMDNEPILIPKLEEAMQEAIKALEQEQKTGHWIMTSDYYTGAYECINYVQCSCCHEDSLEEGNYCPNCGAKMIEPQKGEEE